MTTVKSENRCADCLSLELTAVPVEGNKINLPLTIKFNQQSEQLLEGLVSFGLKGGTLELELENCTMPYENIHLSGSIELTDSQEEGLDEDDSESTRDLELIQCHIIPNGNESKPAWVFQLDGGGAFLKGSITSVNLGTLQVTDEPARVKATFTTSLPDVFLTHSCELSPEELSRNQEIILERAIARYILESKFKPYVSLVQI